MYTYFVSSFLWGRQIGLIIKKPLGIAFWSIPPQHKTDRKENMNAKMLPLSSFSAVAVSELGSAVFFSFLGMMALKLLPLLALLAQVQLPVSLGETMLNRNASRKHTCFTLGTTRFLCATTEPNLGLMENLPQSRLRFENLSIHCHTVDGKNPQQPPGMYKTL